MKLTSDEPMITPRVPVIARLRPKHESPDIWPLKAVAMLVLCIIAASAACSVIAEKAQTAADSVRERVTAVVERMEAEQECAEKRVKDSRSQEGGLDLR